MRSAPIRALLVGLVLGGTALVALAAPAQAQTTGTTVTTTKPIPKESEDCIKLLEGGALPEKCHEAPSPILPATNELIWGSVSFFLLFLAMRKFAWPALKKGMDDRTERIRTSLDEADRVKAEAETLQADYQRQLGDARNEAARIIEEARQTADQLRKDLATRAETEAAELRQRNAEAIAGERDRVMAELQGQVAALAVELAERVVEANLDRESNLRLIENYINSVGTGSGARR
jgi:F-type H+-transporting ATPase subunit b